MCWRRRYAAAAGDGNTDGSLAFRPSGPVGSCEVAGAVEVAVSLRGGNCKRDRNISDRSTVDCMKHLTYADKSLLIDDATADALLEYAALLARVGDADSVSVSAYSADGQTVEATLLLDAGAPIMSETTHSTMS